MSTLEEPGGTCHERARRAVFGYVAPAILHETNNVLTVMAGVRQLLRAGQALSERVGTMIDQQLARMEALVGAIRRVGPEENEPPENARDASFVADAVSGIVSVVGKGRGLLLERESSRSEARPGDAEALALATLCIVLPALPPRGGSAGTKIALRAADNEKEARIEIEIASIEGDPSREPEFELARALMARVGGRLDCRIDAGTLHAAAAVPRR